MDILVAAIPALISAIVAVVTMVASRKDTKDQIKAMKDETDEKQNAILQLTLRTTIQGIYSSYRGDRQIPMIVYQGMTDMYDQYKAAGGNSYIHQLKHEMDEWLKY